MDDDIKLPPADAPPVVAAPKGTSREIHLKSGGTLTLAATLDLFALSSED